MENGSNNEAIKTEQEAKTGQNVAGRPRSRPLALMEENKYTSLKALPQNKIARYARMIEALSLDYEAENEEFVNISIEGMIMTLTLEIETVILEMRKARGDR